MRLALALGIAVAVACSSSEPAAPEHGAAGRGGAGRSGGASGDGSSAGGATSSAGRGGDAGESAAGGAPGGALGGDGGAQLGAGQGGTLTSGQSGEGGAGTSQGGSAGAGGSIIDPCDIPAEFDARDCTGDCAESHVGSSTCTGTCGWQYGEPYHRTPGDCGGNVLASCMLDVGFYTVAFAMDEATRAECDATDGLCSPACIPACASTNLTIAVAYGGCARFTGTEGASFGAVDTACQDYSSCLVLSYPEGSNASPYAFVTLPPRGWILAEGAELPGGTGACPLTCEP